MIPFAHHALEQRCAADAESIVNKSVTGCSAGTWADSLAHLASASPVMINIGANTGYAMVDFLRRFSSSKVNGSAWRHEIMRYATLVGSKNLRWTSCGVCSQCKGPTPRQYNSGGTAHALELDATNRKILRHLSNATGLPITVHDLAAGPKDGRGCAASALPGFEGGSLRVIDDPSRRCWAARRHQEVNTTTVDTLLRNLRIETVEHLSIDTEGWDALVLEGARDSIKLRKIRIIEFEYSRRWQLKKKKLEPLQSWLLESGYHCFWLTRRKGKVQRVVPLSGQCWRSTFEISRLANVACVHDAAYVKVLYGMH